MPGSTRRRVVPGNRSDNNRETTSQHRYDPLAVLSYITAYQQIHPHRSPSQRRIQAALGISAPSVVHGILWRLQRAELL